MLLDLFVAVGFVKMGTEIVRQLLRTVLGVKVAGLPPEKMREHQRAYFATLEIVARARQIHLNKRLRENTEALRVLLKAG